MQKSPRQNTAPAPFSPDPAFWALLLGAALLFGLGLGATDLWAPDEPRYGAIAEEIRSGRHGAKGLILLHLNDVPYTQKPPLYFWLAAALGTPLGRVTEIAARLPSALAGVFCVGLTAWTARRLGAQPRAALLAATLLATSFRFIFTARRAQLDVLLTAFELIALALFIAIEFRKAPTAAPRASEIAGIHAALGAAALVKGPVGWLPLLIIAAYLAWQGRIRTFRAYAPAWAYLLSIAPLLLWISCAIALAPPGFAEIAVGENVFGRFFSGTSHVRPFYYFLFQLPLDFLPWCFLLPFAVPALLRKARTSASSEQEGFSREASAARLLACWTLIPLIFFTLSAGKRGVYLLPVFPALAMICLYAIPASRAASDDTAPKAGRRWGLGHVFAWVLVVALIEGAGFAVGLPRLQSEKSPRPIALEIARQARPQESVGVYGLTPIEGGLTYYGGIRTESLRDVSSLGDFLDRGGRLVLLRARHFEALGSQFGLRRIRAFRKGRRQLILAKPRPPSSPIDGEASQTPATNPLSTGIGIPYIPDIDEISAHWPPIPPAAPLSSSRS